MADRRRMLMLVMAFLAVAPGASEVAAQEVISTGASAPLGGAPPPPPPGQYDLQRHLPDGDNLVRSNLNGCGAPPDEDGKVDKSPHGEVHAGIGNHGYREAGGAVCVPIGDHTAATIAVDAGRYPGWRWR